MQESKCLVCNKTITNPICPECINNEVKEWLKEKGNDIELIEKELSYSSVKCILCNKKMDICPHCYTNDVSLIIKKEFPKLLNEYNELLRF